MRLLCLNFIYVTCLLRWCLHLQVQFVFTINNGDKFLFPNNLSLNCFIIHCFLLRICYLWELQIHDFPMTNSFHVYQLPFFCEKSFPCFSALFFWEESLCPNHQEALVRAGHGTIDWFQIGKEYVKANLTPILSPYLFNLYAEYIM